MMKPHGCSICMAILGLIVGCRSSSGQNEKIERDTASGQGIDSRAGNGCEEGETRCSEERVQHCKGEIFQDWDSSDLQGLTVRRCREWLLV